MKIKTALKKYRALPCATGVMSAAFAFPAFATSPDGGEVSGPTMKGLLDIFTDVAAWMWVEIGKLLTWILGQPILMLAMSLFFVGAIVSFFIRVFHSV